MTLLFGGAVAEVLDTKLHICGFYIGNCIGSQCNVNNPWPSTCYSLLGTNWKEQPSLSVDRWHVDPWHMHMTEADRLVTAGPDLPNPMSSVQTVQYDGDVYVVGGLGDAYDGEILKLEGNTWVTVANTGYNGYRVLSNPLIISGDQIDCQ